MNQSERVANQRLVDRLMDKETAKETKRGDQPTKGCESLDALLPRQLFRIGGMLRPQQRYLFFAEDFSNWNNGTKARVKRNHGRLHSIDGFLARFVAQIVSQRQCRWQPRGQIVVNHLCNDKRFFVAISFVQVLELAL